MAGMSRVVSIAVVLAVIAACSLILLHVFRSHGQTGTVVYGGRTYDCHKVVQSFESTTGPGVYPQPVIDACVNGQP
jgi:MFS superfamily sulfate permease-like transporter